MCCVYIEYVWVFALFPGFESIGHYLIIYASVSSVLSSLPLIWIHLRGFCVGGTIPVNPFITALIWSDVYVLKVRLVYNPPEHDTTALNGGHSGVLYKEQSAHTY